MASANTLFKNHEDYRRQKELEEARKAGIAPAEVDEEGKEINPHIPQYMSSAPWYLNDTRPSLKHQKNWKVGSKGSAKDYYDRGVKVFQATKFRKGACENCGAMSHKTKDCMERPRGKGARWTSKHIAADEKVEEIDFGDFDTKRDRWNGYDPESYTKVIDMYEKVEQQKQGMKKAAELERRFAKKDGAAPDGAAADGAVASSDSDSDQDDEDKITETEEAGYGKVEKRVRTTGGGATGSVRNLRIREDTAKYLLNLDPNSAHYDPKSRSMREDPQPHKAKKAFAGDNFVRKSGDYHAWEAERLHQLAAYDHGASLHMQAAPSQAEILHQHFKTKKGKLELKNKDTIMQQYGNAAEKAPEDGLLLGQTERYVEYDASGRVVKGQDIKAHSRYEEDKHPNNHTSVWGSWWEAGQWGYACCHQTVKNSYCTGEAGKDAAEAQADQMQFNIERKAEEDKAREANGGNLEGSRPQNGVWGTDVGEEVELDKEKLEQALKKLDEREKKQLETDDRKRKYNSLGTDGEMPTEEEMEAYRMKKARDEDPMAKIVALKAAANTNYEFV
ncbi:hypothetical protein ABBQ38_009437 [Trebouxia sp. C0009 RCD-2024]